MRGSLRGSIRELVEQEDTTLWGVGGCCERNSPMVAAGRVGLARECSLLSGLLGGVEEVVQVDTAGELRNAGRLDLLLSERVLELHLPRVAFSPLLLSKSRRRAELGHRFQVLRLAFRRGTSRDTKLCKLRVEGRQVDVAGG